MRRTNVVAVVVACAAIVGGCSRTTRPSAGFWFDGRAFALDTGSTIKLGGPFRPDELHGIEKIARSELERAFSDLNIDITTRRDAHWRVSVVSTLPVDGAPPAAGGSIEFAGFGGRGSVAFVTLATIAIRRAPESASRREMLNGIGRGIGAATAHELAHQILGRVMRDDTTDIDSYEYFSADRGSQYFGSLHWTAARPLLQQKLSNK